MQSCATFTFMSIHPINIYKHKIYTVQIQYVHGQYRILFIYVVFSNSIYVYYIHMPVIAHAKTEINFHKHNFIQSNSNYITCLLIILQPVGQNLHNSSNLIITLIHSIFQPINCSYRNIPIEDTTLKNFIPHKNTVF